jgi:SAM-dependent methyltransferase
MGTKAYSENSWAEGILRPSADDVAEAWRVQVTAERAQVEALPDRPRPEDFYGPVSDAFRADPHRTDEPILNLLRGLVDPAETWIDIGSGGGRYTLPIGLLAREVYAVDPSQGMRETLAASAAEHGITNLRIFAERWPCESEAPVADVAFISQVGYDIADIGPFIDQMEAHARRLCVAVLFQQAPISDFAPLWKLVHGEERVQLPALPQFLTLLFARGRSPEARVLSLEPRTFESIEALHRAFRRPLWVLDGTPEDERLDAAIRAMALQTAAGVRLSAQDRKLALVTWTPR